MEKAEANRMHAEDFDVHLDMLLVTLPEHSTAMEQAEANRMGAEDFDVQLNMYTEAIPDYIADVPNDQMEEDLAAVDAILKEEAAADLQMR